MPGRILMAAMLAGLLAACAGGSGGGSGTLSPSTRAAARPVAAPRSTVVVVPQVMAGTGLGGVIGLRADVLTRRFGDPRIDLTEGDARKLQFAGSTCVLDVFLYPVAAGAEPTATHVAARLRQSGGAVDPGTCIHEVEQG